MRGCAAVIAAVSACGRVGFTASSDGHAKGDAGSSGDAGISSVTSLAVSTTTAATTISSPAHSFAAGDLLIVMLHDDDSAYDTMGVTDTANNTFVAAPNTKLIEVGLGVQTVEIWFAAGINPSPDDVITATLTGAATAAMIAHEYSGLATGQPFEAGSASYAPTTMMVSTTVSTTAGSLVVAFGVPQDTGTIVAGTGTWSAGPGYTLIDHEPIRDMQAEELIGAPAGQQTPSLSYSVAGNMIISAASFHP